MHSRVLGACLVALGAAAAAAVAGSYEVVVDDSSLLLGKHLDEAAAEGLRVTAVLGDVAHRAVVLSRAATAGAGRYRYLVIDGVAERALRQAGADGFAWRGGASLHGVSQPFFVLEHDGADLAPRELRAFHATEATIIRRDLAPLLDGGWRVVGVVPLGEQPAAELLLERRPGAVAHDLEVLEDTDPANLGRNLASSARNGFTLDALWSRPIGLRGGPPALVLAVLSRAHGGTARATPLRVTLEDEPRHARTKLAAWVPFQRSGGASAGTLYVYGEESASYDSCELASPGLLGSAEEVRISIEHVLRQCTSGEVQALWVVPGAGGPTLHAAVRDP